MIAPALRRIEDALNKLAAEAEHEIEPEVIRHIARQVGAQAEMVEKGIAQPE